MADEDGGSARAVAQAADGPFALSPDGRTLALTRAGSITVYDVETGLPAFSGPAESVQPEWLPDSSAVMFMRVGADGVPQMFRVSSDGGPETLVGTGSSAVSSPDGAILALLAGARLHRHPAGSGLEERGSVRNGRRCRAATRSTSR